MKKRNDLSILSKKVSHKSDSSLLQNSLAPADQMLENKSRERVVRKSYALTKQDLENIKLIKDKCLNKKVVLSDSHIIRLALNLAVNLDETTLINASLQIPKILTGRPKGS